MFIIVSVIREPVFMLTAVKQGLGRGAQEEVTVTKQSKAMPPPSEKAEGFEDPSSHHLCAQSNIL